MTTLVLGTVGALAGSALGGPIGASIGWLIGSMLGNLIDPPKVEGPRRSDLKLQVSEYGRMIPFVWGTGRIAGIVIDQTDLTEHKETSGGKGGPEVTQYTYSASFAIMLCAGPILGIRRIWADGRLIWNVDVDDQPPCTVYLGTEGQDPDPTFVAIHGTGNVPAYRGYAYVVFTDYKLTDFGDRIPMLEFEVYTEAGGIPWRVSTFDANPHAPSNNQLYGVGYTGGVIAVGMSAVWRYYENHWDVYGTATGIDVDIPIFASYNAGFLGVVSNLPGVQVWGDDVTNGWYFGPNDGTGWVPIAGIAANPMGGNLAGAAVGEGVYIDGYIFMLAQNPGTLHCGLVRWWARDGVPMDLPVVVEDYGVSTYGSLRLGISNDHKMYVMNQTTATLKVYDVEALTVLNTYTGLPTEVLTAYNFSVYNGMLVTNYSAGGGAYYCRVTLIDGGAFTYIGQVSQGAGPNILLGVKPLILCQDGVISLVPPATPVLLSTIVADLSDKTSVGAYDVAELTDEVRWFAVGNQMTVRNALETLRKGFFFDAVESDDTVKFRKRGATDSVVTIADDDLCASSGDAEHLTPLQTKRRQEHGMPRTVTMRYIDVDEDYQTGAQSSPRLTTLSDSDVTIDLSIGFTATEALQKCWSLQVAEWIEREIFVWQTTREYAWVEPCDVVTVRGRVVRVTKRTESPAGVLSWEGVLHRPSIYTQVIDGSGSSGWTPTEPPGAAVATSLTMLDIPLLADGDYPNGPRALLSPVMAGTWSGAALYKSVDGGATYAEVASTAVRGIRGAVDVALGNYSGGNSFDEGHVLTVVLTRDDDELTSTTETGVLNGANLCALGSVAGGWELLQFRTAALTAPKTYQLTGLLRGRFGTEWKMAAHAAGETFLLLATSVDVNGPFAELGAPRKYRPVTFGGSLASAATTDFTHLGIALKPYAPVHLEGGRNAGGDLTMTWFRRARKQATWLQGIEVPLGEASEAYAVTIYASGAYATTKRVIATSAPSAGYTAAEQTSDFGSAQATVYFGVQQLGAYGYGYEARGQA